MEAPLTKCHPRGRRRAMSPMVDTLLILIYGLSVFAAEESHCPWTKDLRVPSTIKSRCQCARTPGPPSLLSIQCHDVEATQLVSVLNHRGKAAESLELLYLNASKVTDSNGQVPPEIFKDIKIISLQMSGCGIKGLHSQAFKGQETTLKHLSLTLNQLKEVPKATLANLTNLSLLDLSHNRIARVPNDTFEQLGKLTTLKLNDNNLVLEGNAFNGLEISLKNLNLKGTRISEVPEAIGNLSSLAFLDLAQNRIRDLDPLPFSNLHSLTALNLERNLLQMLPNSVFTGINDTLSSLSLLNNLMTQYPRDALEYLHELRVLDLGFNLLTEIPENAFEGLNRLTLLALDGNPLNTLPAKPFATLKGTLRGLSLGGRFLHCDCRISWIADWVQRLDLQITSRERNPQFCGNPAELRRFNFYQLKYDDFQCEPNMTSSVSTVTTSFTKGTNERPTIKIEQKRRLTLSQHRQLGNSVNQENLTTDPRQIQSDLTQDPPQPESIHDVLQKFEDKPTTAAAAKPPRSENLESEPGNEESETSPFFEDLIEEAESKSSTSKPLGRRIVPLIPVLSHNYTTNATSTVHNFPQNVKTGTANPQHAKSKAKSMVSTTSSTSTIISFSNSGKTLQSTTTLPSTTPQDTLPTRKASTEFQYDLGFDDSKIPIITGVGPRIATSPKTGSVVQVRVTSAPTTVSSIKNLQRSTITTKLQHGNNLHSNHDRPNNLVFAESSDIEIEAIERQGESILVQWESRRHNAFRIIYRIFGEDTFRHGPPLAASEREYRIQNVPYSECIVICVVPYEEIVYNEISTSASTIPPGSQCKELKPNSPSALMNHMDKVTIGAIVAICFAVGLGILIFVILTRRAKRRRHDSPIMSKIASGSFSTPSPGPLPIIPPGSMTKECDWDQLSGISTRSIPRARVYNMTMDGPNLGNGPARSVLPLQHSHHHHHPLSSLSQPRSGGDGHTGSRSYLSSHHSHHSQSYNNHHNHSIHGVNSYLNNQSRLLRASLGQRASGQNGGSKKHDASAHAPRNVEQNNQKRRKAPRLSTCDSLNTLSGYDTPDNWTDHDMDVYVTQNATRRDLVKL